MLSHVKRLINWARTDAHLPLGIERPTVIREIETHYVIGGNGVINGAIARPRNKDTCRGDAPPAAVFDEVISLPDTLLGQRFDTIPGRVPTESVLV